MEYHSRKAQRVKAARARLREDQLKAAQEAEAAKLKEEQDKMRGQMDKLFNESSTLVSN